MHLGRLLRLLPWRYAVGRIAKSYGFVDPAYLFSRIQRFSQPSEIPFPVELLRSGALFHARGLINTQAIQHNLDWIWPYWVERQFDPGDSSFLPRAFSVTHVNLTHRNWTAVGLPDADVFPIVDPAGLVTPLLDSWSLDAWLVPREGEPLIPSQSRDLRQSLNFEEGIAVLTETARDGLKLGVRVWVEENSGGLQTLMEVSAESASAANAVVSVRPYNPEGISFIGDLELHEKGRRWLVNDLHTVTFDSAPAMTALSNYAHGDVYAFLAEPKEDEVIKCKVGMATGAAVFKIEPRAKRTITAAISLEHSAFIKRRAVHHRTQWSEALSGSASLTVPDERIKLLYDAALRSLVLHSPEQVYPGPFTYRRFWFRDAAFILKALLAVNLPQRVKRAVFAFPEHQRSSGYFYSQDGEWDSNGEALWIIREYLDATGETVPQEWHPVIKKGARWILNKRVHAGTGKLHAGLLPAGFSAEHLGPSDYYYWDDFWGVAGLRSAALMLKTDAAAEFMRGAEEMLRCTEQSIERTEAFKKSGAVPASPYRRMDAGAIGSIAAGYPLKLWAADDRRLLATTRFLLEHSSYEGAFFQNVVHSGINPYLTLQLAQILLRAGDPGFLDLVETMSGLATPTGQWPEAIHPRTKGGCMGDGQHVWASAEWVQILRNMFVDEEDGKLILLQGVPAKWLTSGNILAFGPTCTSYGAVSVRAECADGSVHISWNCDGRRERTPEIGIHIGGRKLSAQGSAGKLSMPLGAQ